MAKILMVYYSRVGAAKMAEHVVELAAKLYG